MSPTNSPSDLLRAGYPRVGSDHRRPSYDGSETLWPKRFHASADPGRPTHVHIRVDGEPNQRFALLFVDWLNANPGVRADYLDVKRAVTRHGRPWFNDAYRRAGTGRTAPDWSPRPVS